MDTQHRTFAFFACILAGAAFAKDPKIASNTSSITPPLLNSIAASAIGAGVKEPLTISQNDKQIVVKGSNATVCNIKIADGNPPKMLGVSCK